MTGPASAAALAMAEGAGAGADLAAGARNGAGTGPSTLAPCATRACRGCQNLQGF